MLSDSSDISGGFHPSILNAIRMATQTSNILSLQHENYERVDYKEAFRLATLGGSRGMIAQSKDILYIIKA